MAGKVYGYARVSSKEQNLDRQLDAFEAFGVLSGNVFADKASGKDFDRPECKRLMAVLDAGDVVLAHLQAKGRCLPRGHDPALPQ